MVFSDLNINIIGCLKTKDLDIKTEKDLVFQYNKFPLKSNEHWYEIWKIYSQIKGTNCYIYPKNWDNEVFEDEMFDIHSKNNRRFVVVYETFKEDIEKIITDCINLSPVKKIVILFRIQGDKKEVFKGEIKRKIFINHLKQNKILYNVAYVICD